MQRGIDSFFKRVAPAAKKTEESDFSPAPKKRKALVISSDEDEVPESPQVTKSRDSKKTRTDNGKSTKSPSTQAKKKPSPKSETKIDPAALFGGETLRVEAKKPPKPKAKEVLELEDDEIDNSLIEIDIDESLYESKKSRPETKESRKSPTKLSSSSSTPRVEKVKVSPEDEVKRKSRVPEPSPEKTERVTKAKVEEKKKDEINVTPKAEKKKPKSTPRAKKEPADLESSILSDEERHERKRMTAILYQKYKNRSSCLNPGSKEVPKGKPNCLAGLSFLVTGVLESLERDETGSIIKELGGKVMTTVGKRLNYLIVGEDAGPKKQVQAEENGVKIISEDEFLDLIRTRSGEAPIANGEAKKSETKATSPKKPKKELKEDVKVKKEKSESPPEKKIKKERERETVKEEPNNNNNHTKVKNEKRENLKNLEPILREKTEVSEDMLAWVDKYKPMTVKDIIGQQGAASNVTKLTNWLTKWYVNHDGKKKLQKPNPWAKNDDGAFFKAALLSGPPGIGKTTTATLVCKELGFDAVEFNASDTRSKRLLKEEVSELLSNKSLYGYFHGDGQAVTKKHVLIMDEVDGMAGNEDRGGIQELIGLIKDSSVPIICMCNDRNHQKMRSLVNYCYDLRFNRPRLEQIKGRIMSICFKEKIKMEPSKIEEVIAATNNDIRQSINHLSLLSAGKELNLKSDKAQSGEKTAQKDLKMGPWEVVRKVFSAADHKQMTLNDKCDLFFHDYSLAPLFVQQNYLQVAPAGPKSEVLQKVASTADALSLGDLVDKRIRSNMAWSLLPTQAVFSSVMPGEYMSGVFTTQINFPGWLGKNSRATKRSRLAQELHDHTRLRTSGSRRSIRLDYAPFLLSNIVRPLKEQGLEGVPESLAVLKEYHLLREDVDSLIELTTWPGKKGPMDAVDGRVKAALTRAYNKEVMAYTYSANAGVKKKKAEAAEGELLGVEGEEDEGAVVESEDEKEDSLENDGLIKAKKKASTTSAAASTSKAKSATAAKKAPKASTSKAKK